MKRTISILISISFGLTANPLSAQQERFVPKNGEITMKVKKLDTLYGYKYKGKQVLKNKFEQIDSFSLNSSLTTRIKQNGKWGFMYYNGEIIVKPKYKDAMPVRGIYHRAFVYDEQDSLWKMVGSSGLLNGTDFSFSIVQYLSDEQYSQQGFALASKKGEEKMMLITPPNHYYDNSIIKNIDSIQVFRNDQLLLFFSEHKNGGEISQGKQTDSEKLFRFYPDFYINDHDKNYPYFKYVDGIFEAKDSFLILKSYFSDEAYYYNPEKQFNQGQIGRIQHLGGNLYKSRRYNYAPHYPELKGDFLIKKGDHFVNLFPTTESKNIKLINSFIVVDGWRNKTIFDFDGNLIADHAEDIHVLNNVLTLIEITRDYFILCKGAQPIVKSNLRPKTCNNGFLIMLPDSSNKKYVFVNQEGNIVGDTFDLIYEKRKMYFFQIFPISSYDASFITDFIGDSITGRQIIVTKYLADKEQYLFGTMYENGEINIPLKYHLLKPAADLGYIFAVSTKNEYRFGLLDWDGTELIAPKFSTMNREYGGLLKVTQNGRTFYIDKTGKEIKTE